MKTNVDILIVINQNTSPDELLDIQSDMRSVGITTDVQQKHDGSPWACAEWLLPTAVIFFIGKSYLEGFFNKVGEDHYDFSKKMWGRFFGPNKTIDPKLMTILGPKDLVFSLGLSFRGVNPDGKELTLLFQKDISEATMKLATKTFSRLLVMEKSSEIIEKSVEMLPYPARSGRLLVFFNEVTQRIELIDWLTSGKDGHLVSIEIAY